MILNLIGNEVKKIISYKRLVVCIFIILIFCSITMVISFKNHGVYNPNGSYKIGYTAVQENKRDKEKLNGILTKRDITNCITVYKKILQSPTNYDASGNFRIGDSKSSEGMNTYADLADLLTRVYSPLNTFTSKALTEKSLHEVNTKDIIKNRHKNVQFLLHRTYSKDFLLKKDSIAFGYSQGWQSLFVDMQQITMLLIVMVAILVSPVFSKEYRDKMVPVLYTSKYGKSKLVTSKIIASIVVASSLYGITLALYSLIKLIVFGFDGYHLFIQSSSAYWLSILPLTFLQAFWVLLFVGFIAIIATTVVCLFISVITRKDYISIIVSLLALLMPITLAHSAFLQQIVSYMPSSIVNYPVFLLPFQYVSLLNVDVNISIFRILLIYLYTLLIVFMIKRIMRNKQV